MGLINEQYGASEAGYAQAELGLAGFKMELQKQASVLASQMADVLAEAKDQREQAGLENKYNLEGNMRADVAERTGQTALHKSQTEAANASAEYSRGAKSALAEAKAERDRSASEGGNTKLVIQGMDKEIHDAQVELTKMPQDLALEPPEKQARWRATRSQELQQLKMRKAVYLEKNGMLGEQTAWEHLGMDSPLEAAEKTLQDPRFTDAKAADAIRRLTALYGPHAQEGVDAIEETVSKPEGSKEGVSKTKWAGIIGTGVSDELLTAEDKAAINAASSGAEKIQLRAKLINKRKKEREAERIAAEEPLAMQEEARYRSMGVDPRRASFGR